METKSEQVKSKELWRWCITPRTAGFLDCGHCPEFCIVRTVFSSYLEFRMMEKVQKLGDSKFKHWKHFIDNGNRTYEVSSLDIIRS
jgi:hypothetical protein